MDNNLFYSSTYGIGQIISQNKMLQVPLHQRNYSWEESEVEQFLEDVFFAIDEEYSNYFLGSIVLTRPFDGKWGILDGQQRLTTASIMFSAIRSIMVENNMAIDAQQVTNDFLAVRSLGGEYVSRLTLNYENKDLFDEAVIKYNTVEKLKELHRKEKSKSNKLIINAVVICLERIKEWSFRNDTFDTALKRLYTLTEYLDKNVLVVSIEVANESDAYVVFETLNTRGQDLSALDLVKNYIYGTSDSKNHELITDYWIKMKSNIGENQADDFLRIFWMGNYGLIRKSRLFPSLKDKFAGSDKALELAKELFTGSEIYAAIEEPKHEFWQNYSPYCRHLVEMLVLFKAKQVRPVIYACINLRKLEVKTMEFALWNLLVLTIRFQSISKKRTGLLEQNAAKLSKLISSNKSVNSKLFVDNINEIMPSDEEFKKDFTRHSESNLKRTLYFIGAIDFSKKDSKRIYLDYWNELESYLEAESNVNITHIYPKSNNSTWVNHKEFESVPNLISRLGNFVLINKSLNSKVVITDFKTFKTAIKNVGFTTTSELLSLDSYNLNILNKRQDDFAEIATKIWKIIKL
ncbi:DUF262 domain-containing HNH endonuclease family protein [Gaetbulibacter sp. M235]|uniref:DUF262 domain-containing protein n=1 Tax=Gaetbulibacter sp. M235 TaxID=3126510 RepID=UPI00374FCFC9